MRHRYVTQPLDTIKTRMQSIEARNEYRSSFECAVKIFKDEGILKFWSGALPRLARLTVSEALEVSRVGKEPVLIYSLAQWRYSFHHVRENNRSNGKIGPGQ